MADAFRLTIADRVAKLVIDQPDSRANVLSTTIWTEFGKVLDGLIPRTDLQGLVIESAKPGIFIAGADLKELAGGESASIRTLMGLGHCVLDTLEALPFPTVAIIDGAALGGGLEVALACDFRVCGTNPRVQLGLPEIKLGLLPGWGGSQRLTRLVGVEEALERMLTGESYDASDPAPDDLVDETVDSGQLEAAAHRWLQSGAWREVRKVKRGPVLADMLPSAEFLADVPHTLEEIELPMRPAAGEILKVAIQGAIGDLTTGIHLETEAFLRLACSENAKQLIAEFFAKRKR
ncbi:MAG: hypothetical protein EXS09_11820 [Gemmataceae bacterium]|nr:hypothetical protein [Gemmataceae bacterium]